MKTAPTDPNTTEGLRAFKCGECAVPDHLTTYGCRGSIGGPGGGMVVVQGMDNFGPGGVTGCSVYLCYSWPGSV